MRSNEHADWDAEGLPDDAVLALLRAGLARLSMSELSGRVTDEALSASVEQLHRLETQVAAEKLRRIAELDARGACRAQGARSTADLLAQRLQLTQGEAREQADTARALARLPETAAKLAAGELGVGHAHTAVRTLNQVGRADDLSAEERGEQAAELDRLVAGTAPTVDRRQLGRDLDGWAHRAGSQSLADRERRAHANRHLWIGPDRGNPSQIKIEGRLGALAGAQLRAAIEAMAKAAGADDAREPGQRRADALVELVARGAAASGDAVADAAQVLLITTPGALHDEPGAEPSTVDGVGAVSNETARQACCDATVTRVTRRNGEVLDVGRGHRDPSPRQRAAVIARDRTCIGCGRPAYSCQIHHIAWWGRDGGRTDVGNLALVCANCHHHLHHEGWQVTRTADGRYCAGPPGRRHAA